MALQSMPVIMNTSMFYVFHPKSRRAIVNIVGYSHDSENKI